MSDDVIQAALAAGRAVDEARLWRRQMRMAEIGATPAGGVNRAALSPEDIAARKLMVEWAGEFGFEVATDEIANLYIRRPGTARDAAPAMTGSHLDSQPKGGKFDGAYGVVGGFEALEAIERAGIQTRRPIELVAWTNEEGGRFQPGVMGSGVFVGDMDLNIMSEIRDRDGVRLGDALAETLASTPGVTQRKSGFSVASYIEAHIEQGPRLENEGKTIGVVTGIQGMCWYIVEIAGAEAHAGTAPLRTRRDAAKAAVSMVSALENLMADETDTVRFTVGRFEVSPGSPNTVPGNALFSIDLRHPEARVLDKLMAEIEPVCRANARGCDVSVRRPMNTPPVVFDTGMVDIVRRQAEMLGIPAMDMPSGAGHDAGYMSRVAPTGMIFVPCAKGLSHNEAESATAADIAAGASTLAACLVEMANKD